MSLPFDNIDDSETIANEDAAESAPQPNNRIFLIVAAILGGIIVLALACIMIYVIFLQPAQKRAQESSKQTADAAQALALAQSVEQTETTDKATKSAAATEKAAKVTPSPLPPTATATRSPANASASTSTPVVALAATATSGPAATTPDLTQTVSALITQGAVAQKTNIPTSTLLPQSGFAEDVGLPGLLGLAVVLVVVIFLTRRLRS